MDMQKLHVIVRPNSKNGPLILQTSDGMLELYVKESAVGGKANTAAIALLAKHLGVAKSRVTLKSGHTSRHKVFIVT